MLVVDDSVVIRRLLTEVLDERRRLEVAGVAANGRIALAKMPQLNPDVVILDLEMPEMNGLETLAALRRDYPQLPVIMFSTLTERGACHTLEALALGATRLRHQAVERRKHRGRRDERVRDELIPRIKALHRPSFTVPPKPRPAVPVRPARRGLRPAEPASRSSPSASRPAGPTPSPRCCHRSAGGLPGAGADRAAHAAAVHPPARRAARRPVRAPGVARPTAGRRSSRARSGSPRATTTWWCSGSAARSCCGPIRAPQENSCRPAVDVALPFGRRRVRRRALGVVLTGMGQDGLRGAEAIRERGRHVARAGRGDVAWSGACPASSPNAGLADRVLPLDQIAPRDRPPGYAREHPAGGMTIGASDFGFIRDLVRKRAAIILEEGKEYLVESVLRRSRNEGFSGVETPDRRPPRSAE